MRCGSGLLACLSTDPCIYASPKCRKVFALVGRGRFRILPVEPGVGAGLSRFGSSVSLSKPTIFMVISARGRFREKHWQLLHVMEHSHQN